jgi:hypothetical protein
VDKLGDLFEAGRETETKIAEEAEYLGFPRKNNY